MSIAFNGSTSKLIHDPGASLGLTYPFAVFAWLKPTSGSVNQMVFGAAALGLTREAMIYAEGGGSGKVRAFHVGDGGGVGPNSTASVSTSWTPALAVFTSDTSRTIYYGAGAAVTESSTDTDLVASQLTRLAVGVRAKTEDLAFAGEIAEPAIWSGGTALGQTEFDALAAGAVPSSVSSGTLWDYWSLTTQAATHTGVNGRVLTATSTSQGTTHPPVGGDTTAPTLSSPSGAGGLGVCSGSVSTNEAGGDLYAVATASATAPTALQVRNGQDHTGAAALRVVGPQAVSSTGTQSVASGAISGGAGTRYLHFMHEDAAGNRSAVVSSAGFAVTAAATQLVLTVPDAAGLSGFSGAVLSAAAPGTGVTVIKTFTGVTFNGSGQTTIDIAGLGVAVGVYRWVTASNSTGDPAQSPAPVQASGPVQAS